MNLVKFFEIQREYSEVRIETWFRNNYPNLSFNKIQKLLRTGQIRVNGCRVKAGARLLSGQIIRVPPLSHYEPKKVSLNKTPPISKNDIELVTENIIHCDNQFIVLNKPSGIPVQGGSKVDLHIDGLLDFLKFDKDDRPRLVHRLDKDTTGALLIARTRESAQIAMSFFEQKLIRKLYLGIVVGIPKPKKGLIKLKLRKSKSQYGERVIVDTDKGKPAQSLFKVLQTAGDILSLISLEPLTGRTHQLRVHLNEGLGTPILGDGKYGGANAFLDPKKNKIKICLHSRGLRIPSQTHKFIDVFAPLPENFFHVFDKFGFELKSSFDKFL